MSRSCVCRSIVLPFASKPQNGKVASSATASTSARSTIRADLCGRPGLRSLIATVRSRPDHALGAAEPSDRLPFAHLLTSLIFDDAYHRTAQTQVQMVAATTAISHEDEVTARGCVRCRRLEQWWPSDPKPERLMVHVILRIRFRSADASRFGHDAALV